MEHERDHRERADELEQEADRVERASEELEHDIDETRSDWESKQSDTRTPGALDEDSTGPDELVAEGERQDDEDPEAPAEDDARET